MKDAVLFDLGGTLISYYEKGQFAGILEQAIAEVSHYLQDQELLVGYQEEVNRRVKEENYEASDYQVRPLEERLARIFQLESKNTDEAVKIEMCRRFMQPVFALAYLYEETLPTLRELRARGYQTAIITNTPWGSPGTLWLEEIERHGLSTWVDGIVCCRDAGWRKPARQVFEYTLQRLQLTPECCLFVGDDPRWDIVGPRNIGIEAILLDRAGKMKDTREETIRTLDELWERLEVDK